MIGLIIFGILVGGVVVWLMKARKASHLHEQELSHKIQDPDFFCLDEPMLPLPQLITLAMRPELSPRFCQEAQEVFRPECFKTDQSHFLRTVIYYLASLEQTFQDTGFQFVDWGELPCDIPETVYGRLVASMARHMRLNCAGFEVELGPVDDMVAGYIKWPDRDDQPATITLSADLKSHFMAMVKVLSHELSHQMMYKMGFMHPDERYNEQLTDFTSLYVGFFKYILEGITYIKGRDSAYSWTSSTTGYLSSYEMCYLYRLVSAVHGVLEHCEENLTKGGRLELSRSKWIRGLTTLPMSDKEIEEFGNCIKTLQRELDEQENELTSACSNSTPILHAIHDLLQVDQILLSALEREFHETSGTVRKALSVLWQDDIRLLQVRSDERHRLLSMDGALRPNVNWSNFDIKKAVTYPELNAGVMSASERIAALTMAAEAGDTDAQFDLALRYMNGNGCDQSNERAMFWYQRAAKAGSVVAQNNLAVLLSSTGYQADAAKWYYKAAEDGNVTAQVNYANLLLHGYGVAENHVEAAKWFLKAALSGNSEAQLEYGFCCLDGDGRQEDPAEAVEWFKRAADQGNGDALNQLGLCYRDGLGVGINKTAALDCFRLAAGQQHPDGLYNLGDCHWFGWGVPVDRDEAMLWYHDAANAGSESAAQKLEAIEKSN